MLKQRIVTAFVLFAVLLPVLFAPVAWPFTVFSLIGIGLGGWEWGRLNSGMGDAPAQGLARPAPQAGAGHGVAVATGVLLAVTCLAALLAGWTEAPPRAAWWLALVAWVLGGGAALRGGPQAWPGIPRPVRIGLGVVLLWTAWLAMTAARTIGINFVLSMFCLVWVADVAAYFGGRAFGRRKLAPAISPGKSWAGVWSGMLGALVLAAFWLWLDKSFAVGAPSLYTRLQARFGLPMLALIVVFLAAMSVVGDLFESLVKRAAGAKDSSGLLPGHGGILDRIDALLPVLPVAMALLSL